MKKRRPEQKFAVNAETVRHLRALAKSDLRLVNGGSDDPWCTTLSGNGCIAESG